MTPPFRPVREPTPHDLLTWGIQFAREGTLPPEVQRRLLEHVACRPVAVATSDALTSAAAGRQ